MKIIQDDLTSPETRALLEIHFAGMRSHSPAGKCHFLDIEGLKAPNVAFWSAWDGPSIAGCGAIKEHQADFGEIKSMRTHPNYLRRGVGGLLLEHIIQTARDRGYRRLSLETGSGEAFVPAIRLYESRGFVASTPFADYVASDFNQFFTLEL